jgi:hypothetical protein
MKHAIRALSLETGTRKFTFWFTALLAAVILAGCGGGASSVSESPVPSVTCDPNDPDTFSECGSVLVALTDADGDFLNYTVDVVSLKLETANGRIIETLPNSTRVNFTDYVDLTELVSIANVPPAIYVAGTIKLDYSDAEIFVEADGDAKAAVVTDGDGTALQQTELKIVLPEQNRLIVSRGRAALLQLDFDLDASHAVDVSATPALAVSEQFIVAEVMPVDEKVIRVRGPLVSVNENAMTYTVALRPFRDRSGDFGRFVVNVTDATEFEVNDVIYAGLEGLRALDAAGITTPTIASGVLSVPDREFTANLVLAGSSVPGTDRDAVIGNVIKRDGNFLTVRGATIVPSDRRAHFHDDVVVEIGPNTRVFKDGDRATALGIDAISVGQRVTIRGEQQRASTDSQAPQILFDAKDGAVRMHVTKLAGVVNTVLPGTTNITLQSIDRRRAAIFDFTGTGVSADEDADPGDYSISTDNLTLADFSAGKPIVARGFPTAFGSAPPDFVGRTVIDYTDVRSALGIGWGTAGSAAPFTAIGADGIVIDRLSNAIDLRHYIKQGPVLIDLTALDSDTTIVPRESGRQAFYIKTDDSLRMYSDFGEFVDDLALSLNGSNTARSMHAHGQYDAETNIFNAYKVGIFLIEP